MARHRIIIGDCIDVMKTLQDNSIDSVVTDPPYGLTSIVRRFGKDGSAPAKFGSDGRYSRLSKGFMGKVWDGTGIEYNVDMWKEVYRLLKPGGHLLSFGGTRTYHRMACAVEDAGFEYRDCILWIYGSGFPKSLDVGKAIDKMKGVEHPIGEKISENIAMSGGNYTRPKMEVQTEEAIQWNGWGTALKPAVEMIVMARKPLGEKTVAENVLEHGTGAINVDGGRIGNEEHKVNINDFSNIHSNKYGSGAKITTNSYRLVQGRFPSNVIIDEVAAEMLDKQSGSYNNTSKKPIKRGKSPNLGRYGVYGKSGIVDGVNYLDSGGASRFFYTAKAQQKERWFVCKVCGDAFNDRSKHEDHAMHCDDCGVDFRPELSQDGRHGSFSYEYNNLEGLPSEHKDHNTHSNLIGHPTQKPLDLIEYLVKLITPPDGTVLDPFLGSGTLTKVARNQNFSSIGIEQDDTWIPVYRRRLRLNEQLPTGDVTYEIVRFQE